MLKKAFLVAGLMMVAADAHALDPYMWGIGPRVGTMVIPGRYPLKLPEAVDGSSIEKVRHDVSIGVQAAYYLHSFQRMLLDASLGFGKGYLDAQVMVKWNYVMQTGAMDFLLGGGTGFGSYRFKGDDPERLVIPYYPLRAETSALIRDNTRGYQGTIYAQFAIPANHYYTNADGDEEDAKAGVNFTVGVELAVLFGDFTPPRPR
ncbi:MAG: hypothetical protein JRI25_08390 [Deltaproteobacteria bacterium]|nr:hypothetical protein [Deltaproteobacteria bacterium]